MEHNVQVCECFPKQAREEFNNPVNAETQEIPTLMFCLGALGPPPPPGRRKEQNLEVLDS